MSLNKATQSRMTPRKTTLCKKHQNDTKQNDAQQNDA